MAKSPTKKVLFTSHTANFQKFNRPFMRMLKEQGYTVHYASAGEEEVFDTDEHFTVPFERSPFKRGNIKAYFALKKVIDREKYDLIHTHTPMGSVVTRLAARAARKRGTRVIYTAHGFHFFKGAPLLNWIVYYPIEKFMARHTDTLITINNEDYERATAKFKTDVKYVPGVGVDPKKFGIKMTKADKTKLRKSLGLKDSDFVIIYAAELSKRKNQQWLLRALRDFMAAHPDVHLVLPGIDSLKSAVQNLVNELGLSKQVHFLGYRDDIPQLMKSADMAVSASLQEGLPVNVMEAMYLGLPIVATDCRGNRDLVEHDYIVANLDATAMSEKVSQLYADPKLRAVNAKKSGEKIEQYLLDEVKPLINGLYTELLMSETPSHSVEVSVVIPAYNAERTIERALISVLDQSAIYTVKEVIVIDDGSFDATGRIVKATSTGHPHGGIVRYVAMKNSGVSHARNVGIELSKSGWIALLDSDDYWTKDKLKKQIAAISKHNSIRFIGANSQMDIISHGEKIDNNLRKLNFIQYMIKSSPSTCSIMFEKTLIDEVGLFDVTQRYAEDANLFMRMIHHAGGYYIQEKLLMLDEKPTFGASGLSSNVYAMHEGCLKNIRDARQLRYISIPTEWALMAWEYARYLRRIVLTRYRLRRASHV